MGAYGSVAVLLLAGWSFLQGAVVWAYLGAVLAFEVWLALRVRAGGSGPAAVGEPPYHFAEEEAQLVGRYRFYFTDPRLARQCASVLAAIGLSALLLAPWLTYRQLFAPALLVGANLFLVARLTLQVSPMSAVARKAARGNREALRTLETHNAAWAKIRAGNAPRG